jgi:uncharacterized membrane protein
VLKIWNWIAGDSVFSMRLLSALFTSASIFYLYPVCLRVMNPVSSLIVLLVYSLSPLNLYYSQEVRMSAMNLFLNLGSVYYLIRLTENLPEAKSFYKDNTALLFIFFTAAAIYTHYFSFFIIIAEVLFLSITYKGSLKHLKVFSLLYGSVVALYLVWIPDLLVHMTRGQSWRSPQSLASVLNEYLNYAKDLSLGLYYYYADYVQVGYLTYVIYFFFIIALTGLFFKKRSELDRNFYLVLFCTFIPLILAGIISFNQKIEFYRYLSILVPYISIIICLGLGSFKPRAIGIILLIMFLGVNIYGINANFAFDFKNDDYRPLIKDVENEFKPGDRIYVEPHYFGWAIDYYKKQERLKLPNPVYIRYGWNEILDSISVQKPERFWIVLDYSAVDTAKYSAYAEGLRQKFREELKIIYPGAPAKIELYRFTK